METGPLAGFPVLDVEVELFDGGFHAVDSSAIAFEIAAKGAFRQSMPKAGPQLLEPIMKVDVFTPEDNVGDVIGDLNRRRGMIKDQEHAHDGFNYSGGLSQRSIRRGSFWPEGSHMPVTLWAVANLFVRMCSLVWWMRWPSTAR